MDFQIDPEFKAFLPPLSADEFALLRKNIVDREEVDPLVIAVIQGERFLLDGHNRYDICHGEGIAFPTRDIHFPDRAAALLWMVEQQFGRRNLTAPQRAYYIGKQYLLKKQRTVGEQVLPDGHFVHPGETPEKLGKTVAGEIAKEHKINEKTVRRDAEYAEALDTMPEEEKKKVLSGESRESKKTIIAKAAKERLLCRHCSVREPRENCPDCKALRAKAAGEPAKLKSGDELYVWKPWEDAFGRLYREIDKLGNAYKCKESPKAGELREKLKMFKAAYRQWFREVSGKKPPTE